MRVVFLDIDGVLVTRASFRRERTVYEGERYSTPDPLCVAELNRITETTGAVLVLSSTWRTLGSCEFLRGLLSEFGVTGQLIDKAPYLEGPAIVRGREMVIEKARGHEIQAWLDARPGVESFVILDDESDMEHLTSQLVQTSFDSGLCECDADRAIAILTNTPRPQQQLARGINVQTGCEL